MKQPAPALTPLERVLALFTRVRPGEGSAVLLLLCQVFVLLFSYYLLKSTREALILAEGSAELRSYTIAAQALLLALLIPIYSASFRHGIKSNLFSYVIGFFVCNLLMFYGAGLAGLHFGIVFYIWLGVFSVMVVAQFWAVTTDLYSVEAGHRLFAVIAVGGSLGAWIGSLCAKLLFPVLGPYHIMGVAALLLCLTIFLGRFAKRLVPQHARARTHAGEAPVSDHLLGGFQLIAGSRYLLWIAAFAILLNCINSVGEYILSDWVKQHATALHARDPSVSEDAVIGAFYGDFYAWVNLISLLLQLFVVSRLFRIIGVGAAMYILPVVALVGYGCILFLPIFTVIRAVKILENSIDYSLQNTARHALFLPVDRKTKFEGQTTIDTFFWRFGDLLHAGVIFVGLRLLDFGITQFAVVNIVLSVLWLWVVSRLAAHHKRLLGARPERAGEAIASNQ